MLLAGNLLAVLAGNLLAVMSFIVQQSCTEGSTGYAYQQILQEGEAGRAHISPQHVYRRLH